MTLFIVFTVIAVVALAAHALAKANPKEEPMPIPEPKEKHLSELEAQLEALQAKLQEVENVAAQLDEKDAYESIPEFFDRAQGFALSVDIQISYLDSNGLNTSRLITTKSYQYTATEGMIYAHCHLRNSGRNFLFTRILQAVDPSTGAVIDDLRIWLDTHYNQTPNAAIDKLLAAHWDGLNCLHYVAKADGAFRIKERELARAFLIRHAPDATPAVVDSVIEEVTKWYAQSSIEFGKHLRKLVGAPLPYRQDVIETAEAMIASDKSAHTNEERAIKRLRKELLDETSPRPKQI